MSHPSARLNRLTSILGLLACLLPACGDGGAKGGNGGGPDANRSDSDKQPVVVDANPGSDADRAADARAVTADTAQPIDTGAVSDVDAPARDTRPAGEADGGIIDASQASDGDQSDSKAIEAGRSVDSDGADDGGDKFTAWGIDRNLKRQRAGHPLGSKIARPVTYKEIGTFGLFPGNGAGKMYFNAVLDSSKTNDFGTVLSDENPEVPTLQYKPSWPLAVTSADLAGKGRESMVAAIFQPDDNAAAVTPDATTGTTAGTLRLRVLSCAGTRPDGVAAPTPADAKCTIQYANLGAITFCGAPQTPSFSYGYWDMHVTAGDVDGDGKDEIAIVAGTKLVILPRDLDKKLTGTNPKITPIQTVDVATCVPDTAHPMTLAQGDVDGDGNADFVVAAGSGKANTIAQYQVWSWDTSSSSMKKLATGGIQQGTSAAGVQVASVGVGDIDTDGQDEVVFAGGVVDDPAGAGVDGARTILAAKWDSASAKLDFSKVPNNGYTVPSLAGAWYRYLPLRPLRYYDSATSGGTGLRKTIMAYGANLITYEPAIGFKATAMTTSPVYDMSTAVGDVNRDGNDELIYLPSAGVDGVERLHVVSRQLSASSSPTPVWTDATTSIADYIAFTPTYQIPLVTADLWGESEPLEYVGYGMEFSDPKVIAVLASAPYYSSIGPQSSETYIGWGKSSSTENTFTLGVSAGIVAGGEAETPIWGSAGRVEGENLIEANFKAAFASSTSQSFTAELHAEAGDDFVVYSAVPYDSYHYRALKADGTTYDFYVRLPRVPQVLMRTKEIFNTLPNNPARIDSTVLSHTVGTPSSYPSYQTMKSAFTSSSVSGLMFDTPGQTIGPEGGSSRVLEITMGSEHVLSFGVGLKATQTYKVTCAGSVLGAVFSQSFDYEYTIATSEETIFGALVHSLPSNASASLTYNTGLAAYTRAIPGQDEKAWVVNFWVN